MTDKLTLYNTCLVHLRERTLASLTEQREPRRVLDTIYPSIVAQCLENSLWRFAKNTVQIDHSTTFVPAFGWNFAFPHPVDWVRTILVSTDPALATPLTAFQDATGFWYANFTPLYVSYVSNDVLFGNNLGAWPETFAEWVSLRLAVQSCARITGSSAMLDGPGGLLKREFSAKRTTKANDAMNAGPEFPPVPFWVRARRGAFQPGMPVPGSGTING